MEKVLVLGLLTAAMAHSASLWVNDNASLYTPPGRGCKSAGYATIQAAVNASSSGDTIYVCPGKYTENVTIEKSNLTVVATGGAYVTSVFSAAASHDVFFITRPKVTLDGFTLVPAGQSGKHDVGVDVGIEGAANAVIVHNFIRGGRIGVNLSCGSSSSTVAYNIISGSTEAGINVDTCEVPPFPGSSGNVVYHNSVCGGAYPYSIAVGGSSNQIHHNFATWISSGGTGNFLHHNVAELFLIAPGNTQQQNTIADVCR